MKNQTQNGATLPSHDLFSVFIRENKAGALGNTLAHCGIVKWADAPEDYWDDLAREWWKSSRPCVIDWDKINTICTGDFHETMWRYRNFGRAKVAKLQEFMGITPTKRQKPERPICPHCGQRYSPPNARAMPSGDGVADESKLESL